ncbi:MAG: hypothetical protein JNK05_05185 [Myxococcales bacterium]|nr:hypothetical protein [Myxococcales bacterium]
MRSINRAAIACAALLMAACSGPTTPSDASPDRGDTGVRPDVQGNDVRTDVPNPPDVQENDVPNPSDVPDPSDVMDPDATMADVPSDTPMMCPMGQMLCGTMCVDTNTSASNCGMCGRSCGPGQTCAAGMCQGMVMCGMGETACGMACANLQTDPMNCGSCGGACMAGDVCTMGRCGPPRMTCPMGQTDCTPMAAMPTCVDTQTSNMNCGACGTACMAGTTCVAGACTCAMGTTLCGRACVNTQTDGMNCGGCGTVCPMGQVCNMGACGCPTGQTLCGGVCVNTQTDNANCGTCGTACAGGTTCTAGACACPMGQTSCGTPAACTNTQTDNSNCGMCGRACAMGQTCTAGACACPMGTTLCGAGAMAACVNTQTSSTNCGACGMVCAMGTSCMAGRCMGTPPANDTRMGATVINLAMPSQTLMADTTAARNNTSNCRCTNGNDVFYTFTITQPEVIYADTFGATWDTSLFIQDAAGANVAATPGFVTCNDDAAMAGFCTTTVGSGLQSQIVARLNPGMYFLVLSGCGAGTAGIHFQHAPAGNGTTTRIAPDATTRTAASTTAGTGTASGTCCSTGADNSLFWITCPNTAAASLNANTCNTMTGVSTAAYNVSLSQNTPARGTVVCNDDITGVCGNGSSVVAAIPATTATTANLNTIVVDGCAASGAATVNFTLAPACAGTQTRCNAACVDTQTDTNNCGACSRRCAVGNRCLAGACVAPPANDLPAMATVINMAVPQTIITGIDTRAATNNTAGSCGCTSGNDVFFNFTIPAGRSEIIYADTLGSSYDTSLFVQTLAGTNITASNLPANGVACNDDGGLAGCGTGLQSQIMLRLDAGTYRLVLSGCGVGTANLRFQHAPVGGDVSATGLRFLAAGASTPGGTLTTLPAGRVNLGCNAAGPEHTFYWHTCAAATGGTFTASTCGRATWDTSIEQHSPGRPTATVCNDDVGGTCGTRSSMTSMIPAGAGLHTFYMDTYNTVTPGAYTVSISRP